MIKKRKILIVIADYYSVISNSLLDSAKKTLIKPFKLRVITVPGVFEIPVIISKNINSYDAFVALGCVIKGKTPHFDFISRSAINAIMHLSITYKKPIGNAVITCLNKKQANERLDKGSKAALAVCNTLGRDVFNEK